MVALSWLALTYCVGSTVVPLELVHFTTEQGRYPFPVTTSAVAELPAKIEDGASDEIGCGTARLAEGLEIVNCRAFDVPEELETVTATGLGKAASVASIAAVTCVELVVAFGGAGRGEPFQFTTESLVKPVPVTTS